jgi:hypothetical protein
MAEITEFNIGQGETFKVSLTLVDQDNNTPLNLTNYSFQGQVRENYDSTNVAAEIGITKLLPYTSGSIFVQLTADQTATFTQRKYVYDILMTSGSINPVSRRVLEGYFVVRPSATR